VAGASVSEFAGDSKEEGSGRWFYFAFWCLSPLWAGINAGRAGSVLGCGLRPEELELELENRRDERDGSMLCLAMALNEGGSRVPFMSWKLVLLLT